MKKIAKVILFILVCEMAGLVGSVFTTPAIPTWYASLNKPSFNPPNWVFAPVWSALFALMGIALFLVWEQKTQNKQAKILFAAQLFFNVLWSVIFFGIKNPGLALVEIMVLWLLILLTAYSFFKISKPAGLLFLPYLAWVSFAALLNWQIFLLN